MAYCVPKGIPHSVFLKWNEDDQDKALGWELYQRQLCSGCGTEPSEWVDEDGFPVFPPPYQPNSTRCYGCVTLNEENRKFEKMGNSIGVSLRLGPYTEGEEG